MQVLQTIGRYKLQEKSIGRNLPAQDEGSQDIGSWL